MDGMPIYPNVQELAVKNALPQEIRDVDGTLLMRPYGKWGEQPLVMNRKVWKVYPNYTVDPRDREILWINTTGRPVRVPEDDPDVEEMLGFSKKRPGMTVEELIATVLQSMIEQTGDFENEDQFGFYLALLYIKLALLVSMGVLRLVK